MKKNYTEQAEKAISKASRYAAKMGRSVIGTEHLLYGLAAVSGMASRILKENDIDKIENIKIDKNLSKMERILDFIENTKNPYIFCIDGIKVKFEYSDNGIRLSECINNLIINKFK